MFANLCRLLLLWLKNVYHSSTLSFLHKELDGSWQPLVYAYRLMLRGHTIKMLLIFWINSMTRCTASPEKCAFFTCIASLHCLKPWYAEYHRVHFSILRRCSMQSIIMSQQTIMMNSHQSLNQIQAQHKCTHVAHLKIQYYLNLANPQGIVRRCNLWGRYGCFWPCMLWISLYIYNALVSRMCCVYSVYYA